jgi:hypothetical protein
VTRVVPVDERDQQPGLTRVVIHDSINLCFGVPQTSLKDKTLKGYYAQEEKHGSRFQSSYTKEQIKRAWAT